MKTPKIRLPGLVVSQIAVAALMATAVVSTAIGLTVVPASADEPGFLQNSHQHLRCDADFSDCQISAGGTEPTRDTNTNCSFNTERTEFAKCN